MPNDTSTPSTLSMSELAQFVAAKRGIELHDAQALIFAQGVRLGDPKAPPPAEGEPELSMSELATIIASKKGIELADAQALVFAQAMKLADQDAKLVPGSGAWLEAEAMRDPNYQRIQVVARELRKNSPSLTLADSVIRARAIVMTALRDSR